MGVIRHAFRTTATLLALAALAAPGCDGDDDDVPGTKTCTSKGGPVPSDEEDTHCGAPGETRVAQVIGKCTADGGLGAAGASGSSGEDDHDHEAAGAGGHAGDEHEHEAAGAGGHQDEEHEHEEEHAVLSSNHGADDDCKYDVSFTTSCVELNKPVTFTLKLAERASGDPAVGAHPENPEVFLADDPSHISPSLGIKAPESPKGTYALVPIVFDRSGRWVIRFHFYETCSDVPEDSPHGHVAFYIDVP